MSTTTVQHLTKAAAGNAALTKVPSSSSSLLSRTVVKKVLAIEQAEGAGAKVRRSIGTPSLKNISPFLMLDHFTVGEGAGFPDHPHRGQTTVTYMLEGFFNHEDFAGHAGKIGPGDLQWMSAGKGIMHAEMPVHRDEKGKKLPDPVGLQLWLDLPEENKKDPPTYQEFSKDLVPQALPRPGLPEETEGKGWSVKVIAGESHGVQSPVRTPSQGSCWYLDIVLDGPGSKIFQEIPTGFNAFIYGLGPAPIRVGDGTSLESRQTHEPFHTLVLSNKANVTDATVDPATVPQENGVWIEHVGTKADQGTRVVVVAGQPLDQEVFQYGPFVLTSQAAVKQTLLDYQMGLNGFERAPGWRSKIGGRH
ncbi:hypothetical protein CBS101457_002523 [Exobasidium rhododendri]|nr:hypothetical protein CBS101457_002523 [Exobasidium rhododendri]